MRSTSRMISSVTTDNRQPRFRYTWSRTWPDKPEDYVAHYGDAPIGRVYRINSIQEGGWFWTCYALVGNRSGADSGQVANLDEACHAVEAAYDELMARIAQGEAAARSEP